jgi:hypothetical protein
MKYPRIAHIQCSHPTDDDIITKEQLFPQEWIATEKVDGAQLSIEFEKNELKVANRGTPLLQGSMDRQFHILPSWIYPKRDLLYNLLGHKLILFGEWLFNKHTVVYNKLSDWFIAFDLYDKETSKFLPFDEMCLKIENIKLIHVPIIYRGIIQSEKHLFSLIKQSQFGNEDMEGIVLHSFDGQKHYKYVTEKFHESIDTSPLHWRYKTRQQNQLEESKNG